jgi:hypothetical protein
MNSEFQTLQSVFYTSVLDLFKEIKELNPTVCSGTPGMSEDLKLTQSGYIYLQACGSDGSELVQDEGSITQGIHLRWALRKELAQNHIPKGDLANMGQTYYTRCGYSKNDDYVTIRKTPYINRVPAIIDLTSTNPDLVQTVNGYKRWIFNVDTVTPTKTIKNKIYFHFNNNSLYNSITHNPSTDADLFLAAYTDYIEIEIENKLFFRVDAKVTNTASCQYKYETIFVSEPGTLDDISISTRKSVMSPSSPHTSSVTSENLRFFRIKMEAGSLLEEISIETYYDFINSRSWDLVDDFGLTVTDSEALTRFDSSIENNWPRYNDGTTVKANNYIKSSSPDVTSKWASPQGLKEAVIEYLNLSKTDSTAKKILEDDLNELSKIEISYVSMLNLVAMDYHIARMFGLGHIDNFSLNGNKYVYLAEYYTSKDLPNNPFAPLKKHLFMCLPTDLDDTRLPKQPVIDDLTFGLPSMDNCNSETLIDEDGYSKIEPVRYININRDKYDYEVPFQSFFAETGNFDSSQIVKPIFYGIEYKETSESAYRKPEITADPEEEAYLDNDIDNTNGIAEMIPVPEKDNPLFNHKEIEEGTHKYALYAINWFNRASQVSAEKSATTTFPVFSKLVPPVDLSAHYIQIEKPRLFTSANEQIELADRIENYPTEDNFWTRVTFNWNHIQKIAYQTANELEFFFKPEAANMVKGKISGLTHIAGGKTVWIEADSFRLFSTEANQLIEPEIDSNDFPKFIGSRLITNTGAFEIVEISQGTTYPRFKIKMIIETGAQNDDIKKEGFIIKCKPVGPAIGEYFTIYENLNNEDNWIKLDKTISLIDFGDTDEEIIESDGSPTTFIVGGINVPANVEADPNTEPIPGLYKITTTYTLDNHPQMGSGNVYWHKGIIRIPIEGSGIMKSLPVVKIESQNPLILWAMDSIDNSNNSDYEPIETGSTVTINYHPGYRVYIKPESSNDFDNSHLMPETGEKKRVMLMCVRSKHGNMVSSLSAPTAFFSLDIKEPTKPNKLVGAAYATRPDIYGKSSYTFDSEITSKPFSLIAYRCHDTGLLDALYDSETIEEIRTDMDALDPNEHDSERFYDLINVIFDDETGHEEEFAEYDGYRFPFPNKVGLFETGDTFEEKKQKMREAVEAEFIPILPQPALHDFIKNDGSSAENTAPVIRDKDGSFLEPDNALFNPFPSVRRFTASSKNYIRFTDFGLDGGTKNIYFYCLKEMSEKLEYGEMSEILGPVFLVNTFPPEAPGIRKIETVLADPYLEINPGIKFEINPYFDSEDVKKVRIYRTIEKESSESVRTMELAGDFDLTEPLKDEFADLTFPPFGKDIYYRLVALRKIKNEFEEIEYVPSKPSEIRIAKVVDNVNPPSPEILSNVGTIQVLPPQLQNVDLTWAETCYEGKYSLYKMSDSGFWQLVEQFDFTDTLLYNYSNLDKEDADGDTIYHRFKIVAENANGLLSLDEKVLVI